MLLSLTKKCIFENKSLSTWETSLMRERTRATRSIALADFQQHKTHSFDKI